MEEWRRAGWSSPQRGGDTHLEAVDKQQVELRAVISGQKILLQVLQVRLNVSLHLLKTERSTQASAPPLGQNSC